MFSSALDDILLDVIARYLNGALQVVPIQCSLILYGQRRNKRGFKHIVLDKILLIVMISIKKDCNILLVNSYICLKQVLWRQSHFFNPIIRNYSVTQAPLISNIYFLQFSLLTLVFTWLTITPHQSCLWARVFTTF